jgi:cobalt-zinc-cadmium efflux system outer membrane protein
VVTALRENPLASATARDVSAARTGVQGARALANPQILFTPAITNAGSDEEVLVQQPLELNGARSARGAVASARLRRTESQAGVDLHALVAKVKVAYYDLIRSRERHSLATSILQTAEAFDQAARRQAELGSRAGIDQAHTAIEVARGQQQVRLAIGEIQVAQAALNGAMGREPSAPVGLLTPFSVPDAPLDRAALVAQALRARGEIAVEEAQGAEARGEASLARAEGRPDLAPQFRAERVTRGVEGVGVGLGITLPLWDYGSRRSRIRQAEETSRAQADRAAAARNQVLQEVEQALARVNAAEAVVKTFQQGVLDRAQQLLDASKVGFQAGATNILSLLEAQRSYRTLHLEYIDAQADLARAYVDLERATGAAAVSLPRTTK